MDTEGDQGPGTTPGSTPGIIRVLIADDDEHLRELVRALLDREPDFAVIAEVADGTAAVEAATTHRPDVVLLDLAMPGMDGLEALPLIKQGCPTAFLVVLSGAGVTSDTGTRALRLGAQGYFDKAGSVTRVAERLREMLRG
jgi:DNA-binding NarL/FixJ family response regulator